MMMFIGQRRRTSEQQARAISRMKVIALKVVFFFFVTINGINGYYFLIYLRWFSGKSTHSVNLRRNLSQINSP